MRSSNFSFHQPPRLLLENRSRNVDAHRWHLERFLTFAQFGLGLEQPIRAIAVHHAFRASKNHSMGIARLSAGFDFPVTRMPRDRDANQRQHFR